MRVDDRGWRIAAMTLVATSLGAAALLGRPPDAIGSPRRVNAPSRSARPLVLHVAEIGLGPAAGMTTTTVRDALVSEAAQSGEIVVSAEGAQSPAPRSASRSRFAIRAAVTQFDRARGAFGYRVRCAVSLLVEESPGGRVRMVLSGRATSEGELPRTETRARSIENAAVRGAVRSALRHVTRDALLAMR